MASNTNSIPSPATYGSDPTTPNTTFVQADPSNFRAVVQKLTGASSEDHRSAQKLIPLSTLPSSRLATQTHKAAAAAVSAEIGPKKPNFKLHERRHAAKKLELSIGVSERPIFFNGCLSPSPSSYVRNRGKVGGVMMVMGSPVSPLELFTPRSPHEEEEERAIAEKGFYLHPSPLNTPRGRGCEPPQLLTLFPLHSPRQTKPN